MYRAHNPCLTWIGQFLQGFKIRDRFLLNRTVWVILAFDWLNSFLYNWSKNWSKNSVHLSKTVVNKYSFNLAFGKETILLRRTFPWQPPYFNKWNGPANFFSICMICLHFLTDWLAEWIALYCELCGTFCNCFTWQFWDQRIFYQLIYQQ